MMHKKLSFVVAGMLLTLWAAAQQTQQANTPKARFSSINQVGLLSGQSGEAAMLQTINGVAFKGWFAGVGAGLDYYRSRGIPLFIDVRKDLLKSDNTPFVYVDGGIHLPWETTEQLQLKGYEKYNKAGGFFDAGVGWKINTKNNRAWLFSAGYSYKRVINKAQNFSIMSWPRPEPSFEYHTHHYRRVVIKVGIQL